MKSEQPKKIEELKEPKDLGAEIAVSPKAAAWTNVKNGAKKAIMDGEIGAEINRAILALSERKLKEEEESKS